MTLCVPIANYTVGFTTFANEVYKNAILPAIKRLHFKIRHSTLSTLQEAVRLHLECLPYHLHTSRAARSRCRRDIPCRDA